MYNDMKTSSLMSPFPTYDTEDIQLLKKMMEEDKINYDSEPVECCGNCKWLHMIETKDYIYCCKCGSINMEIEKFDTIFDYINEYGDIWNLKEEDDERETSNSTE